MSITGQPGDADIKPEQADATTHAANETTHDQPEARL
jgi:hypothetical protein